jgi:hypothetical protein
MEDEEHVETQQKENEYKKFDEASCLFDPPIEPKQQEEVIEIFKEKSPNMP